jgi:signal transduction histidine kinase
MTRGRTRLVTAAALACGAGVIALVLASDQPDAGAVWAVFGPAVGWSFVGTGVYAWRRRPESRTGELMVWFGFAWFLSALHFANSALLYSIAFVTGGLWGGVFLHLVMAFPSGRLTGRLDRRLVIAGYLIFTVASIPAMLVAGPHEVGCDACPANVLLIQPDPDLAAIAFGTEAVLYAVLFVLVLVRLVLRWRATRPLERLQLTPVYVCGLLAFLLVTVGTAGATDPNEPLWWAAFAVTAALPAAFLGGLLRSRVAWLDAELRARLEELRASRARLVEASDTERRRLERNLHDGAQARFVGLALLLGHARRRVDADPTHPEVGELLDRAIGELKAGLADLRELARGIHPPLLTEQGLEPALRALTASAPVPVTLDADAGGRLPGPVEIAAYFVVAEALANVAKYARATAATVAVRRVDGRVTVDVADDGVGGADAHAARACAGSPTASRCSTGRCPSTAPRGAGRACTSRSRCGLGRPPGPPATTPCGPPAVRRDDAGGGRDRDRARSEDRGSGPSRPGPGEHRSSPCAGR